MVLCGVDCGKSEDKDERIWFSKVFVCFGFNFVAGWFVEGFDARASLSRYPLF